MSEREIYEVQVKRVKDLHTILKKNRQVPLSDVMSVIEPEGSKVAFNPEITFGGCAENLPVCLAARAQRVDIMKMLIEKYHADVRFTFFMSMMPTVTDMDAVPVRGMTPRVSLDDYVILSCCNSYDLCNEMLAVVDKGRTVDKLCSDFLLLCLTTVTVDRVDPRIFTLFLSKVRTLPTDCDGRTSLHHCALMCNASTDVNAPCIKLMQELVKFRSSLDIFDDYGLTALQYVCRAGCLAAVRVLIAAGADVNVYWGPDSCTALHLAAAAQSVEIVHELLRAGAHTKTEVLCNRVASDFVSIDGDPSDVARKAGNFRLARYLADPLRSSLGVLLDSAEDEADCAATMMFEPTPGDAVDGTCMICLEETKLIPLGHCHHAFCKSCLANWFRTTSNGVSRPKCPHTDCNLPVSIYDIQAVLGNEEANRVDDLILQRTLSEMPDFRWCPRCNNGGFFSGECNDAECVTCSYKFCTKCMQEAHPGMTCAEKCAIMVDNKVGTARWMAENTKLCPACHVPICKNGGCSHMRCTRCSYEFCWFCLGKYQGVYTFDQRCPCPPRRQP